MACLPAGESARFSAQTISISTGRLQQGPQRGQGEKVGRPPENMWNWPWQSIVNLQVTARGAPSNAPPHVKSLSNDEEHARAAHARDASVGRALTHRSRSARAGTAAAMMSATARAPATEMRVMGR